MLAKVYPGSKYIVVRRDLKRIKDTVIPTYNRIKPQQFIKQEPTQYNDWTCITANGSEIKFFAENKDKDPELKRFRGLEYDSICFEEMDIHHDTFIVGIERCGTWKMRERQQQKQEGKRIPPAMVIGTSNPQRGWVKKLIYDKWKADKLPDNWLYIPARVFDNPYIPSDWIENQKKNLPALRYKMMIDGDWEVNINEEPFFHEFNPDQHVTFDKLLINESEPLWLSFDFNVDPCTCIAAQKIEGKGIFVYACHQVDGGTRKLLEKIEVLYRDHPAGLMITGDFSGNQRNAAAVNTNFQIIQERLYVSNYSMKHTHKANAQHTYSRTICNEVFYKIPILIDGNRCEQLISDLETAMPNSQGGLLKDRDQHKQDAGDAFRYLINAYYQSVKDINKEADLYR